MSQRELNMTKILASVQEQEEGQQDNIPTNDDIKEISTQLQINRLKKAKEIAKSDEVRSKLQEEIEEAEKRKAEENERKRNELATVQNARGTGTVASNVTQAATTVTKHAIDGTRGVATDVTSKIATVSTPGGIALPITILIVFFFLIIPIGGYSRIQWLWFAITGHARIQPEGQTFTESAQQQVPQGQTVQLSARGGIETNAHIPYTAHRAYNNAYIGKRST